MAVGAFLEPAVVVALLVGGTILNRNESYVDIYNDPSQENQQDEYSNSLWGSNASSDSNGARRAKGQSEEHSPYRMRELRILSWRTSVVTRNTRVFREAWLSKVLLRFPFLVEVAYWALIYWVYQLGRAFTAVTLVEDTVQVARRHALQLVQLEEKLGIFLELPIQSFFLSRPMTMHWINWIYSYVHIPASISFLIWLYRTTTVRKVPLSHAHNESLAGPVLFEARRRTMATCNLLAFTVFTLWPCMPPRLLDDKIVKSPAGTEVKTYGFVDTVHSAGGESSIWTQNRFCNQYAAMPSLHFGYSLLIGLSIAMAPIQRQSRRRASLVLPLGVRIRMPTPRRLICMVLGLSYALTILVAIISTANHFLLDAIAGAVVCAIAWYNNTILLNLLPLEDLVFWFLRAHKPVARMVSTSDDPGVERCIV